MAQYLPQKHGEFKSREATGNLGAHTSLILVFLDEYLGTPGQLT